MALHSTTGGRAIRRLAQIWTEMDYAQRRLFEIRTGVPAPTRPASVAELEAIYARGERSLDS